MTEGKTKSSNTSNAKSENSKKKPKSPFSRNSGPYHEPSILLNKLLDLPNKKSTKLNEDEGDVNRKNNSEGIGLVGGLKSLVFKSKVNMHDNSTVTEMTCSKSTYATICQTIQSKPHIDTLLDCKDGKLRHDIMKKCRNIGLVYILLHELLFSKFQSIRGGGTLKRIILKHEKQLRSLQKDLNLTYEDIQQEISQRRGEQIVFPRYARINTIKSSLSEVVSSLSSMLKSKDIYVDSIIPHLLVLPPQIISSSANFHSHSFIQEGKLILQDKSSCFPALALIHATKDSSVWIAGEHGHAGGDVLDACAAPGNKTSHLAALLTSQYRLHNVTKSEGKKKKKTSLPKVFAFDRDRRRFKILQSRMNQLVSQSSSTTLPFVEVHPVQTDFLQSLPSDPQYKNLRAILLDPSCSGSGIVTSPDRELSSTPSSSAQEKENDDKIDNDRIHQLSKFQQMVLRHAMSFPQVQRIVYSTCSIHEEENEGVVAAALSLFDVSDGSGNSDSTEEQVDHEWELISPACLDVWKRRGNLVKGLTEEQAKCLIRCDPRSGDETNGFFVSCFQRKTYLSENPPKDNEMEFDKSALYEDKDVEMLSSLPVYDSEFKIKNTALPVSASKGSTRNRKNGDDAPNENKARQDHEMNEGTGQQKKNKSAASPLCSKKQKKLLWKKMQREKKEQRMKSKLLKQEQK